MLSTYHLLSSQTHIGENGITIWCDIEHTTWYGIEYHTIRKPITPGDAGGDGVMGFLIPFISPRDQKTLKTRQGSKSPHTLLFESTGER